MVAQSNLHLRKSEGHDKSLRSRLSAVLKTKAIFLKYFIDTEKNHPQFNQEYCTFSIHSNLKGEFHYFPNLCCMFTVHQ